MKKQYLIKRNTFIQNLLHSLYYKTKPFLESINLYTEPDFRTRTEWRFSRFGSFISFIKNFIYSVNSDSGVIMNYHIDFRIFWDYESLNTYLNSINRSYELSYEIVYMSRKREKIYLFL